MPLDLNKRRRNAQAAEDGVWFSDAFGDPDCQVQVRGVGSDLRDAAWRRRMIDAYGSVSPRDRDEVVDQWVGAHAMIDGCVIRGVGFVDGSGKPAEDFQQYLRALLFRRPGKDGTVYAGPREGFSTPDGLIVDPDAEPILAGLQRMAVDADNQQAVETGNGSSNGSDGSGESPSNPQTSNGSSGAPSVTEGKDDQPREDPSQDPQTEPVSDNGQAD